MSLKSVIDDIKLHLTKGRLNMAAPGIVKTLEDLDRRVAAIEERNRAKDCICKKTDENGDFEIVKRLQGKEERKVFYVEVGDASSEELKAKAEELVRERAQIVKPAAETVLKETKKRPPRKK